jgi:hypothetical protein
MGGPTGKSPGRGAFLVSIAEMIETRPVKVWLLIWAATAVALGVLLVTSGLDTLNARGKGLVAFVALGWLPPLLVAAWQRRGNRTDGTGEDEP